jgi:hypothetical protein
LRNVNRSSEFGPDIWIVDGPSVRFLGVTFPTRMIAVKLVDGSLWSNSPISAPPGEMARLADIGPVRYLVALTRLPNSPVKHMG